MTDGFIVANYHIEIHFLDDDNGQQKSLTIQDELGMVQLFEDDLVFLKKYLDKYLEE